jgi:hypothetical protein
MVWNDPHISEKKKEKKLQKEKTSLSLSSSAIHVIYAIAELFYVINTRFSGYIFN